MAVIPLCRNSGFGVKGDDTKRKALYLLVSMLNFPLRDSRNSPASYSQSLGTKPESTMKYMKILVVAAMLCGPANAQNITMSPDEILDVCTRADMDWISFCNGFFQAVLDNIAVSEEICVPTSTTRTNFVELFQFEVTKMIEADPVVGNRHAVVLATELLRDAFSCSSN